MRHAILAVLWVALGLAACGSSHYGAPTSATTIDVQQTGGFAGPSLARGVRIVGTTANYSAGTRTGQATLETADVAAMIGALEDIGFLDLQDDYTTCKEEESDQPTVTISATLPAGSHTVRHYLGCHGGLFDELAALDQKLFSLSGYSTWAVAR